MASAQEIAAGVLRGLSAGLSFGATIATGPAALGMGWAARALAVLAGAVERGADGDAKITEWESAEAGFAAADATIDAEIAARSGVAPTIPPPPDVDVPSGTKRVP